ncbi:MAG: hypothetical protein KKA62_04000 [Nanoarchaeota archaeon]|nr:hypothetical protein [Nanoarchaeota archaeon]MBU1643991.1 hypothetical protein [Nanoarchaeota archaeon]MBU1977086.1 hypothetical protein [Nanoarchaeota archaeon]
MEKTTTELTTEYIRGHPYIKSCLKKGLINYSSLARLIAKDLEIEKKTSKEAILIAARRLHDKLKKEFSYEEKIKNLLAKSEIEIKNKIVVFILEKNINFDSIQEIQKQVRKEYGLFYLLEGSDNYTLITQEKYFDLIGKYKLKVIKTNKGLALINFKSQKEIEQMFGVVSYLASLFAENGVNIVEFLSCWTDTLFVIEANDVNKTIGFLKF